MGKEFMERGIEKTDGYRQTVHLLENSDKILFLKRKEFFQRLPSSLKIRGENHLPDGPDPVFIEKHMFRPAKPDPFGAEFPCHSGVMWGIGIGPDAQPPDLVHPAHDDRKLAAHLGSDQRSLPPDDFSRRSVQGNKVPPPKRGAPDLDHPFFLMDLHGGTTDHAAFSHPPRHDRGMGSHPAAGRQDSLRVIYASNIFGRRLRPD